MSCLNLNLLIERDLVVSPELRPGKATSWPGMYHAYQVGQNDTPVMIETVRPMAGASRLH
jgi:hypothetical protein